MNLCLNLFLFIFSLLMTTRKICWEPINKKRDLPAFNLTSLLLAILSLAKMPNMLTTNVMIFNISRSRTWPNPTFIFPLGQLGHLKFIGKIFIFAGSSRNSASTVTGDDAEPHGMYVTCTNCILCTNVCMNVSGGGGGGGGGDTMV